MLSASTFAVTYFRLEKNKEEHGFEYYLGVSVPSYVCAIIATYLGFMLASQTEISDTLMRHFAMILPIHFVILTAQKWPKLKPIVITVLGFALTPVFLNILGVIGFVVAPLAIAGAVMCVDFLREDT